MGLGSARSARLEPVVDTPPQRGVGYHASIRYGSTRSLKAAMDSRLTADWKVGGGDINQEIRAGLVKSRLRAREQALNNNYVRRYLRMNQNHVVGPQGFKLQVQGKLANGKSDQKNNQRIERLIDQWSLPNVCDIVGRKSFSTIQRLIVRSVARDGECLVRLWDVQPTLANPIGFVLEVLDAARLDHQLNLDLPNGNRVRMGIEINNAGRPIAYYLLTNLVGESVYQTSGKNRHERVIADNLLHIYLDEFAEQLRGLTWMTAPMGKLHQLDGYSDAALVAARVGAAKMGFFHSDGSGLSKHALADGENNAEEGFLTNVEPGEFGILPEGWQFSPFNPDYPSNAYEPFTKAALREAATGFGVSYHGLTGDLRDVNFSSIRSGTLEEREEWQTLQQWFISAVLTPVYQRLINNIALYGLLGAIDAATVINRFAEHYWQPRRWAWVDPLKDMETAILAIQNGLKSPQQVADEMGIDIEEVLNKIAEFQQLLIDKKITLTGATAQSSPIKQGGGNATAA